MAIQTSIFTLSGKIGELVHYRRKGKNFTKSSSKEYKLSENTRKTSNEFGRASRCGALMRKGFASMMDAVADDEFYNRLNSKAINIISSGPKEFLGNRRIVDGDVTLLDGLEFNIHTRFEKLFRIDPTVVIDPLNAIILTIPEIDIKRFIRPIKNSKMAVLQVTCFTLDFEEEIGIAARASDLEIPLNETTFEGGTLEFEADAIDNKVIVVAIAVFFKTKDNYRSRDRQYYAGKVLKAALVKDGKVVEFKYPEVVAALDANVNTEVRVGWKLNGKKGDS